LTERLIGRSDTQVGYSDPVIHYGMVIAQEIKVTLGIDCCPIYLLFMLVIEIITKSTI